MGLGDRFRSRICTMSPTPRGPLPPSRCCARERWPPGATYGVRRASQVGQDVLFCLSGSGAVELGSRRVEVQAGEVVWIANEAPHAHIADARDALDAPLVPLRRSEPSRRAHAPVRRRGPAGRGKRQSRTRRVVRAAVLGVEAAGPQPRFSSQSARQRVLPLDGSLARRACLARRVGSAQRRRRCGARRYPPVVERRGDRPSREV